MPVEHEQDAARYLRPDPRVRAGLLLGRNRAATSCMDLSDGLADGVRQIAQASSVGMTLDAAAIPMASRVKGLAQPARSRSYRSRAARRRRFRADLYGQAQASWTVAGGTEGIWAICR